MKDTKDLSIVRLNIQLTKKCNQRCRSCNSYKMDTGNELTLSEINTAIHDACEQCNINNIAFTGGEPTIRRDIIDITRMAACYAPNVSITTNGYYFKTRENMKELLSGG